MTAQDTQTSETSVRVRLGDLGLAPENLRFDEPADDGIPRLADTFRAAGVIYPPIVRPARRGESGTHMVLDGRRRRFALLLQVERGERSLDDEIECRLAPGKAAQAAALVLTATEQAPVHLADVIVAIGKLRRSRMDTAGIAAALGYDELEIKRLEALSAVHPKVLEAFRAAKLTLRQVRMFARLGDKGRQAELAESALDGYFPEYQLQQAVQKGRVTVETAALRLVGPARYAAAGGRVRADLFGELPDVLLDPEILETLWRERAGRFAEALKAEGLDVYLGDDRGFGAPDDLLRLPYVHDGLVPEVRRPAYRDAGGRVADLRDALEGLDLSDETADEGLAELLAARLAYARAGLSSGAVAAVLLHPAEDGVETTFFWRMGAADDGDDPEEGDEDGHSPAAAGSRYGRAEPPDLAPVAVEVDVDGLGHAVHELRTDVATRGLMRDLADHPGAALTAVTAQLFKHVALHDHVTAERSALMIAGVGYRWGTTAPIPTLDGEVRGRLARRRADFLASGLRPIPWVDSLPHGERVTLLAELVALSLNVREARTTSLRAEARAEAVEIAALCGADITHHWAPDAAFLGAHSKAQLMAMLAEMGVEDGRAGGLKKAELVDVVAEAAAERRWAPAALQWASGEPEPDPAGDTDDPPPAADACSATDGEGEGEDDGASVADAQAA